MCLYCVGERWGDWLLPVRQSKPHINVYQGGKIMSVSTKVRLVCGRNYAGNIWKQNRSPNGLTAYIRRPGHSMKIPQSMIH